MLKKTINGKLVLHLENIITSLLHNTMYYQFHFWFELLKIGCDRYMKMQLLKVDKKMTQSIKAIVEEREGRVWGGVEG